MERGFDIFFSLLALAILFPLLAVVVIVLRFTGEGEILFVQERIGMKGQLFDIFKFATMLKDSPNRGTGSVTIKNDPRVLPVGSILRKSKINELPQLLNILRGDMSIIGPRPLTTRTFGNYSRETQEIVKQVRPGLSGIGSIVFRNEEEILGRVDSIDLYERVIAPYKGRLEEWFVFHQGTFLYLLLIFVTIVRIFFPKSTIVWNVFKDLPVPPGELERDLNYSKE